MIKKLVAMTVIASTFISCNSSKNNSNTMTDYNFEVVTVSAMKKVMMGEDLSAHLYWDTISSKEHLFAVAPLGRIDGEVTVIDGKMFYSTVNSLNQIAIKDDWDITSPFAVMSVVREWESFDQNITISSEDELQTFIEKIAKEKNYDLSKAFPFRIIGNFNKVDYHIISKPKDEEEHNHDLHDKAKKHFSLQNVNGQLLGFYSQNHEGVFTHKGHYIHTHFLDDEIQNTGHLENIKISGNIKILLPKK